jgi:hypothetical protein
MHTFRIQYLSNLFLGTAKSVLQNPAKQIQPNAPYLALLGNIGRANCPETKDFLGWAENNFQRIYWVPGPLEYSSHSLTWRQRADATYTFLRTSGFKKTVFCQKYMEPLASGFLLATPTWHLGFSAGFDGQITDWSSYGSQVALDMKQMFDLQDDETNWILRNSAKKSSSVFLLTYSPISYTTLENQNILFHLYGTGYETGDQSVCGGTNPWVGINSATSSYFKPDGFIEFKTGVPRYS